MIDTNRYFLLDSRGFKIKEEAYEHIQIWYKSLAGVTTCYEDGQWFIVQIKALM